MFGVVAHDRAQPAGALGDVVGEPAGVATGHLGLALRGEESPGIGGPQRTLVGRVGLTGQLDEFFRPVLHGEASTGPSVGLGDT